MADSYSAAIVTFRRPESLATALEGLARQDLPPTLVVVADNDPDRSAEEVVTAFGRAALMQVEYFAMASNLGPAGGWARGVSYASTNAQRGDWIAILDDDDAVTDTGVMARLVDQARSAGPEVAAIGLRGARLRRRTALLTRVSAHPSLPVEADYLASGGAPIYRWSVIDRVGFFDEHLFFGFEDLELGLRLQTSGYRLLVAPEVAGHVVQDSASARTAWREYFKTRSLIVICRRHLGPTALAATCMRTLVIGSLRLLVGLRRPELVAARWCGARDGLRNKLGPQGRAPTANPAK